MPNNRSDVELLEQRKQAQEFLGKKLRAHTRPSGSERYRLVYEFWVHHIDVQESTGRARLLVFYRRADTGQGLGGPWSTATHIRIYLDDYILEVCE